MDNKDLAGYPIFFKRNRVGRVYDGGMLFHDFLGDEKKDGKQPEEWIASAVKAINKDGKPNEGLSVIENTDLYFSDFLKQQNQTLGILVKYLDSAVRLPLQTHPDKAFSRRYFNSEYGKTEMWLVLATRKNAKIYFGFNRQITKPEFLRAVEQSLKHPNIMEELLHEISVKSGDVFLIPARCVHAIGAGCLILEVQEPTDFTISPEYFCGDYRMTDQERYLGLKQEDAISCFDFNVYGKQGERMARKQPITIKSTDEYKTESLVSFADTPCFAVIRHTIKKGFALPSGSSVWVVTEGSGEIIKGQYNRKIKKGDYFFMSKDAKNFMARASKTLTLIECLPPLNN